MSYGSESQVAEPIAVEPRVVPKVFCSKCGNDRPRRVERKGFMQKRIYPLFGYYPWYCRECHQYCLLRRRHRRKTNPKQYVERGS